MLRLALLSFYLFVCPSVWAADAITPSGSIMRMTIGLAIVLLVMAGIAWAMKKTMRGKLGQQNTIRIVDGVSVGTRERVMVLEVADRWLVVGVAAGQVTQIANLPAGSADAATDQIVDAKTHSQFSQVLEAAQQPQPSNS